MRKRPAAYGSSNQPYFSSYDLQTQLLLIIPGCLFIRSGVIINPNKCSGEVMQVQKVNDNIDMIALFKNGKIKPLVFLWRGQRMKDLVVLSSWEIRYGEGKRVFFKVCYENDTIYQIYLDTNCWRWTLETVFVKWV